MQKLQRWWQRYKRGVKNRWAGRPEFACTIQCSEDFVSVDWQNIYDEEGEVRLRWDEIVKVTAYKRDCYAYDMICMNLESSDGRLAHTEEQFAGWQRFVSLLPKQLPGFPEYEDWFQKVAFPAFATNITVLFSR